MTRRAQRVQMTRGGRTEGTESTGEKARATTEAAQGHWSVRGERGEEAKGRQAAGGRRRRSWPSNFGRATSTQPRSRHASSRRSYWAL